MATQSVLTVLSKQGQTMPATSCTTIHAHADPTQKNDADHADPEESQPICCVHQLSGVAVKRYHCRGVEACATPDVQGLLLLLLQLTR